MDREQRIVYIQAQTVCAMAEIEGMKAANMERQACGSSMAYTESDFSRVPQNYGITHNQVIAYLQEY